MYIGKNVAHDNFRTPAECDNYVQTTAETMETIDKLIKQMPNNVDNITLVSELKVLNAPHDSNVAHSKKSQSIKKAKQKGKQNGDC